MDDRLLIPRLTDATETGKIHWTGMRQLGETFDTFTAKIAGHTIEISEGKVYPIALLVNGEKDERVPIDTSRGGFTTLLNTVKLRQVETEKALDAILTELGPGGPPA